MAHVGGQREDVPTDIVAMGGGRLFERPDRKSVPQLMERYPRVLPCRREVPLYE